MRLFASIAQSVAHVTHCLGHRMSYDLLRWLREILSYKMGGNVFLSHQHTNYMTNEWKKTYVFCDFLDDIDVLRKTVHGGCSLGKYTPVSNRCTPRSAVSYKYMGNRDVETPHKFQVL